MAANTVYQPIAVGDLFGRWTVIATAAPIGRGRARWLCKCECGTQKVVQAQHLNEGSSAACGCQRHRIPHNRTHNMRRTPEYRAWMGLKTRCTNPNTLMYFRYGGRGITVCDEWASSFEAFFRDMGPRPGSGYSVDRRDNEGPYAPWNCRWATRTEQNRNTSRNRFIECNGRRMTATEWAAEAGISYKLLLVRLNTGWPPERAIYAPKGSRR